MTLIIWDQAHICIIIQYKYTDPGQRGSYCFACCAPLHPECRAQKMWRRLWLHMISFIYVQYGATDKDEVQMIPRIMPM
jgi:hypothetical protein